MEKIPEGVKTVLLIPYYTDKRKLRRAELGYCLKMNLANEDIDQVIAVCDIETKLLYHEKLTVINIGRRQKYDDMFALGNSINPDGINIVANADIFFKEDDVAMIRKIDFTNTVLALSRWDITKGKVMAVHHKHKDSQDSWIWRGKINVDGNFEMGKAGCDNRVAYEIGKNYNIINPSNTIKSYHLHLSGIRNYKAKDVVPPPYLRVPCCFFSDKGPRKVLHVSLNPSGQTKLNSMLASFGEYRMFEWKKALDKANIVEMRNQLTALSRQFKPDLTFMQIQTPGIIDQVTASKLKGFVLNWTGDVREDTKWLKDLAPCVDATCFTNETDTEQFREEGFNSRFIQIGFEDHIFTPIGPKLSTKNTIYDHPDVVFMGNNYKDKFPLSKERYDIAKKLRNIYGNRFLLCGQGWDIDAINLMGKPRKEAMVYRSCKIAINANHFIHKRFSSDRVHRIMGSGAFCLTRWYPGIEKDFIDGFHLRTFKDLDEMIYLINYYLKHEDERIEIADAGCRCVRANLTWAASKGVIRRIASFPQDKMIVGEKVITTPMSGAEWMKFLKEPE